MEISSTSKKSKYLIIISAGIFIVLFLGIFEPFGIESVAFHYLLGYGAITIISCLFYYMFLSEIILKRSIELDDNYVIKQIPIDILNFFYSVYIDKSAELTWNWFWKYQFYTFAIGVIISILMYFIIKNIRLKSRLANVESLNRLLEHKISKTEETAPLIFESETKNEKLVLLSGDLYFIKAEGNYSQFYYIQNNTIKNSLLRLSLKNTETLIEKNNQFLRIHRSYIVNTEKIKRVSSENNIYKIWIDGFSEALPASRQTISEIKNLIQ